MIFIETRFKGVYIIQIEKIEDERGFFARSWCRKEFEEHGLNPKLVQCNISYNKKRGTVRGMHYQVAPCEEAKLVSCIRGSIYDVIIDMRSGSLTKYQWLAVKLDASDYRMLYVPEGYAHGFQTLENDTVVFYQMTEFYHPEYAKGIRWNDPVLGIEWPIEETILSEKDKSFTPKKIAKNLVFPSP